ncbi:MAG: hypothetical protein J6Z14_06465 [Prevotella sp.]|nr:hypothetical protein [Prevotella sp.]
MKKTYQAPSTISVLVQAQLLLDGSVKVNRDTNDAVETGAILSRETNHSIWDDEEDEE